LLVYLPSLFFPSIFFILFISFSSYVLIFYFPSFIFSFLLIIFTFIYCISLYYFLCYKGLGEMDAHQLAETTMDPRHRILRRIRIEDTGAAENMFDLLMGSEVGPRREFIADHATELDPSRIDA